LTWFTPVTYQRLPRRRIPRAQIRNKIVFDENPSLSRLRARELTRAGAAPHFLRVHQEERCGLVEI
jgi:hypothetical protein